MCAIPASQVVAHHTGRLVWAGLAKRAVHALGSLLHRPVGVPNRVEDVSPLVVVRAVALPYARLGVVDLAVLALLLEAPDVPQRIGVHHVQRERLDVVEAQLFIYFVFSG